jgi:hypothetical protein
MISPCSMMFPPFNWETFLALITMIFQKMELHKFQRKSKVSQMIRQINLQTIIPVHFINRRFYSWRKISIWSPIIYLKAVLCNLAQVQGKKGSFLMWSNRRKKKSGKFKIWSMLIVKGKNSLGKISFQLKIWAQNIKICLKWAVIIVSKANKTLLKAMNKLGNTIHLQISLRTHISQSFRIIDK